MRSLFGSGPLNDFCRDFELIRYLRLVVYQTHYYGQSNLVSTYINNTPDSF